MSRIIREHTVFGKEVIVKASSVEEARLLAVKGKSDWWSWEAKEISPGTYEVYIAEHDAAFALND
jgi:hypothetical protein